MRNHHKFLSLLFPISIAACSSSPRAYDVSIPESTEHETADGYEIETRVDVADRSTHTVRPVRATIRLVLQKGPFHVETETVNIHGQRVKMVDSPDQKTLTVTVDSYPPVVVKAAANDQYEHRGRLYAETDDGKVALARAIADQLEESNAHDDSVVANIEAAKIGRALAEKRGPKLFFIPMFIDVTAEIEAQMNILVGDGTA